MFQVMSEKRFIREYSGEWGLPRPSNGCISTPSFSPLFDAYLSFHFKCQYVFSNRQYEIILVKNGNAGLYPTLRMDVDVNLYDNFGCHVQQYKNMSVNIQEMVELELFPKSGQECKFDIYRYILKCRMQFWDIPSKAIQSNEITNYLSCDFKHFAKKFATIYESGALSDVKFILGENTLPAHKFVLAAHSPVFKTMLTSDFQESRTDTIRITDSTFEVFGDFLKYLYSGEIVDLTSNKVMELYKLADKYDVDILKRECQKKIPSFLNTDIVCEVLVLAHDYEDVELKNVAKEYAFTRMKELVAKPQWKELDVSHPRIVIDVLTSFVHQK